MKPTRASSKSRTDASSPRHGMWGSARVVSVALCLGGPLTFPLAHADGIDHTVVQGDTLWSIAQQQLGQAGRWPALQRANRLTDPNRLTPGQVLTIPLPLLNLPETSATVVHVHGDVRVTLPGRSEPEALRVGAEVPEGAMIDVRDKSFARLRLTDGSAFGLSAGSRARLSRLRLNPNTQQSQTLIRMETGRVESEVTPKRHPGSRFEVHTPMAVASVRGTRFGVTADGLVTTSEVDEGTVALAPQPKAQVTALRGRRLPALLTAGQGARLDGKGRLERATLLAAPDLRGLPAEFDNGERVNFSLPANNLAQAYRVQVRDASVPDTVLHEAWVNQPQVTWDGLDDGRYILAMQNVDTLGLLGNSARHGFSVVSGPVPPIYRYPTPDEKVPGPTVSLRCTEPDGAQGYRVQVARDADFADLVSDRTGSDTCQQTVGLAPGHYHWRVAALNAAGKQGPYGVPARFEVLPLLSDNTSVASDARLSAFWPTKAGLSYRVQVARDAAFTQPVFDGWLPGARLDVPAADSGTHFLRWQSRDESGQLSRLSTTHRLQVGSVGLQTSDGQPVRSGAGNVITPSTPKGQAR
ncbi:FecR domain-containing protein [Hydrogenophaga sp. OTU3427]|uniref:FecR domain-containing protein n=1 Tax=Hydrogenophaga sp. OTU3427 TaxID=3043856 RepID=UPI00313AD8F8